MKHAARNIVIFGIVAAVVIALATALLMMGDRDEERRLKADMKAAMPKPAQGNGRSLKATRDSTPPKQPDIRDDLSLFLITIDSLRWDGVGFMGYERDVTPNLDKLVRNGTIYERAYGVGSYTGQAVPPMMTGKYPSELLRNDKHESRISGRETFAAELFCKGSIHCAGVLSHHLFRERGGWNQGFDDWTVVDAAPPGPGYIDTKYNSHYVADAAIKWLKREENTAKRFFLWTHYLDPHKEYLPHKGIETFGDDRRAMYDHEVRFTDHHIGRMVDFFMSLPAAKRTVIVVTADHGEAFNEHGRWTHGKELWEEIIRVPLAVVGPGITKRRISRQTSHIDLFPTLLDFFGQKIPEGTHGRSLLPEWVGPETLKETPVIADQPRNPFYESRRVYIADGWKLHHLPDKGEHRLYRITDDYERGDSLVQTEKEAFHKIKAAYDKFVAEKLRAVEAVQYDIGHVNNMPLPKGYPSE